MGRGSAGNIIAALASFFIPGLGQLLQGRLLLAFFMFVLTCMLWLILMGWVIHLWSIIDAALFDPDGGRRYRERENRYGSRYGAGYANPYRHSYRRDNPYYRS